MRVYLDNCCYNRPYDDQNQFRVNIETQAILYILNMIRDGDVELVTSYILDYENSKNSVIEKRVQIADFYKCYGSYFVPEERKGEIDPLKLKIMSTGVKEKDSSHIACAIYAKCDFFISTDDRLLKYKDDRIKLVSPCEFIRLYKEENI